MKRLLPLLLPILLLPTASSEEVGEFSCLGEDHLLTMLHDVAGEGECGALCGDTQGCAVWTWESYPSEHPGFTFNTSISMHTFSSSSTYCLLYSSCTVVAPGCPCLLCTSCTTGLSPSSSPCTSPSPTSQGSWWCTSTPLSLSCTLSCSPGMVAAPRTTSTCTGGTWAYQPQAIQVHGVSAFGQCS